MKKVVVVLLFLIVIGLLLFFLLDRQEKSIDGSVKSYSDNKLVVVSDGKEYEFLDIKEELYVNDYINVRYRGLINKRVDRVLVKSRIEKGEEKQDTSEVYKLMGDEGIFSDYYDKAYEMMLKMSLDDKIGQVLLVRIPLDDDVSVLTRYQFGGYLLFAKDVSDITKIDLINKINDYQNASKIPLVIAIDEEGGTVSRLSNNTSIVSERFKSPQELYRIGGMDKIIEDVKNKNAILKELGINVNLAPVADVSENVGDYIYPRTFGKNASETSNYIKEVINASKGTDVSSVLKHFPGYGNNVDTHTGISIDNRSLESFRENDFKPFEAGIAAGAEAILVNHNIIVNVENNMPASLSLNIHGILRDELKFSGIIMTDDILMAAIKDYVYNPSIKALQAGNDLIIVSDYQKSLDEIREGINNGDVSIDTLNKAVVRVLAWKYYKGMIK